MIKKRYVLNFPPDSGDKPFSYHLVKDYDIRINILKAEVYPEKGKMGICTSAGTVGPSLSFGKADAVVVVCEDVLLADAFATAFGNKVKSPNDVEKVINQSEKYPEILSLLIICEDKIGIKGDFEIKILK